MRPEFDDRDRQRLTTLETEYNRVTGPRVGDYVEMLDGTTRRFTHDWRDCIQTTYKWKEESNIRMFGSCADSGSFYFGGEYVSFSGSLDDAIPKTRLEDTGQARLANFWFFHHNDHCAHNGVDFQIPVRVFREVPR